MNHRDADISDVVVVLDELDDAQTLEVVDQLKALGLSVDSVNHDQSIVSGCIETSRVRELEKLPRVRYVRRGLLLFGGLPGGRPTRPRQVRGRVRRDRGLKSHRLFDDRLIVHFQQFGFVENHLLTRQADDVVDVGQLNCIDRACFFAHAAVDAAQFVDVELCRIFFAVGPG